MSQNFQAGDFLIFQIESAYGILRILAIEEEDGDKVFHLAAYNEMFLDIDSADAAIESGAAFTLSKKHMALTSRAFASTQTARMSNRPLTEIELEPFENWKRDPNRAVSDISVRLLLGLR